MNRCMYCDKVLYPDKKTALTVKNFRTRRRHQRFDGAKELRTYYCERGKGWHLTKKRDLLQF